MTRRKLTFATKIVAATLVLASAGTFMFSAGSAYATPYGTVITKYDGVGTNGLGPHKEENEAEPGMVQSQAWDLEGFFLKGKQLTIAGGYNFYTGYERMKPGDIFVDTNGDAVNSSNTPNNTISGFDYNPGYKEVSNGLFKYDYVLDINWEDGTFNIVKLDDNSVLKDTEYGASNNKPSNPWIYMRGGTAINRELLSFNTYSYASRNDTGFLGWDGNDKHYVATFDISPIDLSKGALFHNTMECGNDNLIGQAVHAPEPSSFVLMGVGLLGAGLARRRLQK
jgi:hypothetical protein